MVAGDTFLLHRYKSWHMCNSQLHCNYRRYGFLEVDRQGEVMKKRIAIVSLFILLFAFSSMAVADTRETWISDNAYAYCEQIGSQYNICPELLMAIIETESSGQAYATNGNCIGLMQVSSRYHGGRMQKLGVSNLYEEYDNILTAADYLAELFQKYKEPSLVLDMYNGNSKAMYNYENGILSTYADKILTRASELEQLHGK